MCIFVSSSGSLGVGKQPPDINSLRQALKVHISSPVDWLTLVMWPVTLVMWQLTLIVVQPTRERKRERKGRWRKRGGRGEEKTREGKGGEDEGWKKTEEENKEGEENVKSLTRTVRSNDILQLSIKTCLVLLSDNVELYTTRCGVLGHGLVNQQFLSPKMLQWTFVILYSGHGSGDGEQLSQSAWQFAAMWWVP